MLTQPSAWIRAAVRYWGGSLSLVQDEGKNWPGFHYTPEEKEQLAALAKEVGLGELGLFLLLNSLIFCGLAAIMVWAGLLPVLNAIYPNIREIQAPVFFGLLGIVCAIMAGIGLPLSIVLSAGLLPRLFHHNDDAAVSGEQVRKLFLKMQWQCLRAGLLVTSAGLVIAGILAYSQGQLAVLLYACLRLVVPGISVAILSYYIGRRAAGV